MTKKISCVCVMMAVLMVLLVGCEVPFSPNAEWKETPVVYCMLDQDDDTTWVRVEKCFLGEGSIYNFGPISDSTNYPQGSIKVDLLEYRDGSLLQTINLQYAEREREEGNFAAGMQPVYFTDTRLNDRSMYKLEVHRASDNTLLASTDSIPLIIKDPDLALFTKPSVYDRFKFTNSQSSAGPACMLEWNQLTNARRYQPYVRFYYAEGYDTLHLDLMCSAVTSGNTLSRLSTSYPRSAFLQTIYEALKDDPAPKKYIKSVDLYLTACDEDINVYINSISNGSAIDQSSDTYTNIHGGVGIFGARRTQLYRLIDADSSMAPPDGLHYLLKNLGVGFE